MPSVMTSDVIILLVFPSILFICVMLVLILLTQLYWIIIQQQHMIAKPNIFTAREIEDNGRQEEKAVVVGNTLIRGLYQYRVVPSEIDFLLNQQKMNMIYISSLTYHNESQTVVTENVRYMVEPMQETLEYSSNSTTV